jgi:hypothetical protein
VHIRIINIGIGCKYLEALVVNGSGHETEIANQLQRSIPRGHKQIVAILAEIFTPYDQISFVLHL